MKKWLVLPLAVLLAGSVALSACGETKKPVVEIRDGYVYVDGERTIEVETTTPSEPSKPSEPAPAPSTESAFELWKKENPDYAGTEAEWKEYLEELVHPAPPKEEEPMTFSVIEEGEFSGSALSGTATTSNGALKMTGAVLQPRESVVLSVAEGASWKIEIEGKLLSGSAGGAQMLVAAPFTEGGRVYLGVKKDSGMVYIGVKLDATYVNFGWKVEPSFLTAKHSYCFAYENGLYTLSVDGAEGKTMTHINFNQANEQRLGAPEEDSAMLNKLIFTVLAKEEIEFTSLGTSGFEWSSEIETLKVTEKSFDPSPRLLSHPLSGTKIFYLGSSITRGEASNGVAFGEIIHAVTGNPFTKEAVSGTTLVDNGENSYVQRLKKLDFTQNPDFLVVQLSTNDFSQGKNEGSVQAGTSSSDFDKTTISGAIQYIIAYAKEQCPTCKVVFYTGAVRGTWGYRAAYESYINGAFSEICTKWNIEPLDIFHTSYKNYPFFWSDDIHPKIEGYAFGWTPLFMDYFLTHL